MTGVSSDSAAPLSFAEHFSVFQLIVLVLRPATLLFWFTLTDVALYLLDV